MTLADRLRLARQYWLVLVAMTAVGVSCGLAYFLTARPTYQAKSQVFVNTHSGGDLTALIQGSTFTQQRVTSYAKLITSPRLLQPVVDDLRLPMTTGELAGMLTVSNPKGTVLIDITVDDSKPARARDIANTVAQRFPILVSELETPAGEARSIVTASRTITATTPSGPVSPSLPFNLLLGALAGLGLGTGVALVHNSLDRSLKSKEQVQDLAGAPVLTVIADDPAAKVERLITHDAFSPRAEAFRQLRTNIRFLSVDQRVSSLVVTSAIAHEGKSTTASNLAITLAQAGESVVLIDADLRRPTLADVFALSSGVGLTSVLLGDLDVHEALQPWRDDLPLQVLTAGPIPPNPAELIGSARMAALISELTGQGITVVLDSPPLLPVTDAALLARATDGALVVTRAAATHTDQLAAACEALRIAGAAVLGVVLNRVPRTRGGSYYGGYAYGGYGSYRSAQRPQGGDAPVPEPARLPVAPAPARLAPSAVSAGADETAAPEVVSWPGDQGTASRVRRPSEPQPAESFEHVPVAASPSHLDPTAPALPWPDPDTRIVLPSPNGLPDAVRAAISKATPAVPPVPPVPASAQPAVDEHQGHPHARPRGRRAARATPEPDLIIDTDRGTATRSPVADGTSWHVEWGDLPALIAGPRASEGLNGGSSRANGSSGRHRN